MPRLLQVEEGDGGSDGGSDKSDVSFNLAESTKDILFTSSLNWLLLLIPVAVVAKNMGMGDGWLFVFSLLPICPLAGAHPKPTSRIPPNPLHVGTMHTGWRHTKTRRVAWHHPVIEPINARSQSFACEQRVLRPHTPLNPLLNASRALAATAELHTVSRQGDVNPVPGAGGSAP